MKLRNQFHKFGCKGALVLAYWLLCMIGSINILFLPSLSFCYGKIFTICIPYGFFLINVITYPATALLQILKLNSMGMIAALRPQNMLLATIIYFCIGLGIDIMRSKRS